MAKFLKIGSMYLNTDHIIEVETNASKTSFSGVETRCVCVVTTELVQDETVATNRWHHFNHDTEEAKTIIAWLEYDHMVENE
jgi:hypothetical protein